MKQRRVQERRQREGKVNTMRTRGSTGRQWCKLLVGAPLLCSSPSLQEVIPLLYSIWRRLCHHGNQRESAPISRLAELGCACACMNVFCANTPAHHCCMCDSVRCLNFLLVCVCVCKHSVQACVRSRGAYTPWYTCNHTHIFRASHSQFVLRALFLARGSYIIRVTLGGNKRKGETSPAFPSPTIECLCSLFSNLTLPHCFVSFFLHPSHVLAAPCRLRVLFHPDPIKNGPFYKPQVHFSTPRTRQKKKKEKGQREEWQKDKEDSLRKSWETTELDTE